MDLMARIFGRLPGRPKKEPPRDSKLYPRLQTLGQVKSPGRVVTKPTPRNLRYFSRTVYARRAINAVRNPILNAEWEVTPREGIEMNSLLEKQIEIATRCLTMPNGTDSFRTFQAQLLEDYMIGACAFECGLAGDALRPLWMWPVDGLSVQIYPEWKEGSEGNRFQQVIGGSIGGRGAETVQFKDDELVYLRPNPSTDTPYGFGPIEIAFNSIAAILGVGEFARNVASNSRPSIGLDLGEGAGETQIAAFREFWRNEVEGQGTMPIFGMAETSSDGKTRGPAVMRFYPEGDTGLYLKWQEFLKAEIATAFNLSPMNLGAERDVNRSTAETAADRDREQAVLPVAGDLADTITTQVVQRRLGFSQLRFRYRGLDVNNELMVARTFEIEYESNATTPDEYRRRTGKPPMGGEWGKKNYADVELAIVEANGKLKGDPGNPNKSQAKPSAKRRDDNRNGA